MAGPTVGARVGNARMVDCQSRGPQGAQVLIISLHNNLSIKYTATVEGQESMQHQFIRFFQKQEKTKKKNMTSVWTTETEKLDNKSFFRVPILRCHSQFCPFSNGAQKLGFSILLLYLFHFVCAKRYCIIGFGFILGKKMNEKK